MAKKRRKRRRRGKKGEVTLVRGSGGKVEVGRK